MEVVFWICTALLIYIFIGYPLLIHVLFIFFGKKDNPAQKELPAVSLILSAYNEEDVILYKISNFQELDYPNGKLELIIVSDGSYDRTDELIRECGVEGVRLLVQERNMGKTSALNRAVGEAKGEILVFTDANSMFDRDALKALAVRFADCEVGLVSGHTEYQGEEGVGAYRRYEDRIKETESGLWGIVGADGAIYAMRKSLYTTLQPQYINDFLHPLQVVLHGSRAVQEQKAVCREPLESIGLGEFKRQIRIMTQSWIIVFSMAPLMLRSRKWGALWQLFSHKVLRWLTLPLMALLLLVNLTLVGEGFVYSLSLTVQLIFYFAAWFFRHDEGGIKNLPYSFLLLHYSAIAGFIQYLKGEKYISWNPRQN